MCSVTVQRVQAVSPRRFAWKQEAGQGSGQTLGSNQFWCHFDTTRRSKSVLKPSL